MNTNYWHPLCKEELELGLFNISEEFEDLEIGLDEFESIALNALTRRC